MTSTAVCLTHVSHVSNNTALSQMAVDRVFAMSSTICRMPSPSVLTTASRNARKFIGKKVQSAPAKCGLIRPGNLVCCHNFGMFKTQHLTVPVKPSLLASEEVACGMQLTQSQ